VHKKPMPLLGGVAIFLSIALVAAVVLLRTDALTLGEVSTTHYLGLFGGALILVIGGSIDDRFHLKPAYQFVAPVLAILVAILGGLGIEKVTNPFGGTLLLSSETLDWFSYILVFLWMLGMIFTIKLLDGLDGLATGVGSIGVLMVLLLSASAAFFQPDMVLLSSIILGALLGFLVWNRHPAAQFLGESGSLLIGFMLGALAILSGGKIATLLLVMGVPILDVLWVMARRLLSGRGVARADREHLHHRLFDLGLSQNCVVALYVIVAFGFGALTLVLSSFAKLIALSLLALAMFIGVFVLVFLDKKKAR
ncbi:MAG: MraY family glycosyltransferase, partial [Patescibacteria group bacterium]